jgi:hypothetical protein
MRQELMAKSVKDFSKATEESSSVKDILTMEQHIMMVFESLRFLGSSMGICSSNSQFLD